MSQIGMPTPSTSSLDGQVALVTGASYGIGLAIATALLRAGARVMMTDVIDRVDAAAAELASHGHAVASGPMDVLDAASVDGAVERTVDMFGRLDIMVNNAGWSRSAKLLLDMDAADWDRHMNINVRGNLFCMQAAARRMIAQGGGGRYIAIGSIAGFKAARFRAHYCTSKAAIVSLVRTAALELAEHGISVNSVAPGPTVTETNLLHASGATNPAEGEAKRRREAMIPLGKNEPEDIAQAVLFLTSPASRRITGQTLIVDGGGLLLQ